MPDYLLQSGTKVTIYFDVHTSMKNVKFLAEDSDWIYARSPHGDVLYIIKNSVRWMKKES